MKNSVLALVVLFLMAGQLCASAKERVFNGLADASAIEFIDSEHFVIADDESNVLLIYKTDELAGPVSTLDLNTFLEIEADSPEADIEAAAKVGDRIYWITSHGRNKSGKLRPNRYRFFCTKIIKGKSQTPQLIPVGVPCKTLLPQLLKVKSRHNRILVDATRLDGKLSKKERKKLAPKDQGFNIEGMMYYPPSKSLLIGLRNPVLINDAGLKRDAIVIELKNPAEVVEHRKPAMFGEVRLSLEGRSIRGMEFSIADSKYYIAAGAVDDEISPALFSWDGKPSSKPRKLHEWSLGDSRFNPESIASHPDTGMLWIVSDDGSLEVEVGSVLDCADGELLPNGKCLNKHLKNSERRSFRMHIVNPPIE